MHIVNESKGTILADRARLAVGRWERLVGLLSRSSLSPGEGLVLRPCSSIHTWFMRFPIDVAFLSGEGEVMRVVGGMGAFRISPIVRRSAAVVELPAGTLARTSTAPGDRLLLG